MVMQLRLHAMNIIHPAGCGVIIITICVFKKKKVFRVYIVIINL